MGIVFFGTSTAIEAGKTLFLFSQQKAAINASSVQVWKLSDRSGRKLKKKKILCDISFSDTISLVWENLFDPVQNFDNISDEGNIDI